jgi:hypothetical protein
MTSVLENFIRILDVAITFFQKKLAILEKLN